MGQDRKPADITLTPACVLNLEEYIKSQINLKSIFLADLPADWHALNDGHIFSTDSASTLNIDFETQLAVKAFKMSRKN